MLKGSGFIDQRTGTGANGDEGFLQDPVELARVAPFRFAGLLIEPALTQIANAEGTAEHLEPRVMQVLVALVRAEGAILTRGDLIQSCWGGAHVGDDAISRVIARIRHVAAGIGENRFTVETLPRVGYRVASEEATPALAVQQLALEPLEFRQYQTIDLKGRSGTSSEIPLELAEALEVETPAPAAEAGPPPRRRLIAAGVGALLLAGLATIAIVQPEPFDRLASGDRQSEDLSLAIMPFATQTDAGDDYLGAGLANALADSLAPLSELKIIASTSTKAVAGMGLTAPEIGRTLDITHLVEGDVHRDGDRYAISVRLIEARTSEQIWARSFEGGTQQLQRLKNRMARELASSLRVRLGVDGGEIAEKRDVDPRAYEAYLRALERVSVRADSHARAEAIKQFRLAASIQPDFADGHAGYAYLLALTGPYQLAMTWKQLIAEQQRATARALELDPDNDLALIARSLALKNFYGKPDEAFAIDQAVLGRSPDFVPAYYSAAVSLWMRGRAREALHHFDQAIERDPFDMAMHSYRAQILYSLGDYEGVRGAVEKCLDPCPNIGFAWGSAMVGFATPVQLRRDITKLQQHAHIAGYPPEAWEIYKRIAEAMVLGRPYKPRPLEAGWTPRFVDAAIFARLDSFEQGLRYARIAADSQHAPSVLEILNEGRQTFTPEQRADPRYHALFRHPKLVGIAAARRKEGVTAGLPVFPVKALPPAADH